MKRSLALLSTFFVLALATREVSSHTWEYNEIQVNRAGDGCVGGQLSSFGTDTAYYCGDAALLNKQLRELSAQLAATSRIEIRFYDGTKTVEYGEEAPIGSQKPMSRELHVDWSISKISGQDREADKRREKLSTSSFGNSVCQVPYRLSAYSTIVVSVWKGDRIRREEIDCPATIKSHPRQN